MNVVSIPITTTSEQQQHPNNNQRNVSFGYSTQQQPSYVFRESTPSESSVVTYTSILSANIENSILSATSVQQQQPVIRNGRIRSATLPTAVRSTSNTNDISATNSTYNNVSITALTTQPSSTSTSLPITSTLPSRNFHTTTSTIVAPPPPTRISSAISSSSNILNRTVLRPTTIAFQCNTPYQTMPIVSQFSSKDSTVTNSSTGQQTPSSMKQMPIQKMPHNPRFMQRPNIPMTASSSTASIKHPVFANAMANSNIGENSANYLKASSTTTAAAAMQRARSANVFRRSPVDAFGNVTTLNNNLNTNSIKRNPNVRQTYGSYYMHRVLLPTTTN
ncbi:unnamed protein product [Didymodactylos carnosus]|nr:unnamed protein product [Didymodactylos carnosus]CAF3700182.1 unnamed protein product [Didymodactylos carnosus]